MGIKLTYYPKIARLGDTMLGAIVALPFERPKLSVVGLVGEDDLAARLDRAIKRQRQGQVIDVTPAAAEPLAPAIAAKPFARLRRGA